MVNMFTHTVHSVDASEVPDRNKFVYLKGRVETHDPKEATERIPIVEVRMVPLDRNGSLVSADDAYEVRITEIGPNGRVLRSSLMIKDRKKE